LLTQKKSGEGEGGKKAKGCYLAGVKNYSLA